MNDKPLQGGGDIVILDDARPIASEATHPWRILIVDDDPSIHSVTRLALDGFTFEDRPLQLINAFSALEARTILEKYNDLAVVLLDVVMQGERDGLDLVRYIRDELGDDRIRIVLRTGQPGQAPERDVIVQYDINDYKEKTDLTAQRLFSLMHACLRGYRDTIALDGKRMGLRRLASMANGFATKEGAAAFVIAVAQYYDKIQSQTPGYAVVHSPPRDANSKNRPFEFDVLSACGRLQGLMNISAGADGANSRFGLVMVLDADEHRIRIQEALEALTRQEFLSGVEAGVQLPSGRLLMLLSDRKLESLSKSARDIIQGGLESAAVTIERRLANEEREAARDVLINALLNRMAFDAQAGDNVVTLRKNEEAERNVSDDELEQTERSASILLSWLSSQSNFGLVDADRVETDRALAAALERFLRK